MSDWVLIAIGVLLAVVGVVEWARCAVADKQERKGRK